MLDFLDILGLLGMILLRFGIPVALMAVAAYFLKRLDARWEAEARASAEEQPSQATDVQPVIAPALPARPARKPQPRPATPAPMPIFIPPPAVRQTSGVQPGMTMAAAQPCWEAKGCSAEAKSTCAAPAHPDQPCWKARLDAEGKIPDDCVECNIFQRYPSM